MAVAALSLRPLTIAHPNRGYSLVERQGLPEIPPSCGEPSANPPKWIGDRLASECVKVIVDKYARNGTAMEEDLHRAAASGRAHEHGWCVKYFAPMVVCPELGAQQRSHAG